MEHELNWLDEFPLKAMYERGIISSGKKSIETVQELLPFFGFAGPGQWHH
jgi:hypothetical protein